MLRRRIPLPKSSPYHDPDCPVKFPDVNGNQGVMLEGSFISRTAEALLKLSDTKRSKGGLHGEWRSLETDDVVLDGVVFELLHCALGPPGVLAVSRFLALRQGRRVRKVMSGINEELKTETKALLVKTAQDARDAAGRVEAAKR